VAGKVLKKMWAYFFIMQQFMLLEAFDFQMPINMQTIFKSLRDTLELNALDKIKLKEAFTSAPPVKALVDAGGLMAIVTFPALMLAIGMVFLARCLIKKYPKIRAKAEEIKGQIFFGAIIKAVQTGYLPMAVASGLGRNLCISCSIYDSFKPGLP